MNTELQLILAIDEQAARPFWDTAAGQSRGYHHGDRPRCTKIALARYGPRPARIVQPIPEFVGLKDRRVVLLLCIKSWLPVRDPVLAESRKALTTTMDYHPGTGAGTSASNPLMS
jgi:hypothetical protein